MMTGGPAPSLPRRRRSHLGCWLALSGLLCVSPLIGLALHLVPPVWALLFVVALLVVCCVLLLLVWPRRER